MRRANGSSIGAWPRSIGSVRASVITTAITASTVSCRPLAPTAPAARAALAARAGHRKRPGVPHGRLDGGPLGAERIQGQCLRARHHRRKCGYARPLAALNTVNFTLRLGHAGCQYARVRVIVYCSCKAGKEEGEGIRWARTTRRSPAPGCGLPATIRTARTSAVASPGTPESASCPMAEASPASSARAGEAVTADGKSPDGTGLLAGGPAVVYVGGMGRSGSTLLERLLGELPGACPAGEVAHLWHRGVVNDERCGCGAPFQTCPFWQKVGAAAFGGWDRVDVDHIMALRSRVDRTRFVPLLAYPALRPSFRRALDEYASYYRKVYLAIAQISGCQLVIDSSKHASLAFCLRACGLDLRVVHVIRDSRAVAYSWSRVVKRPETLTETRMPTYPAASAAGRWTVQNTGVHLLARLGTPTLTVRYEDLAAAPAAVLHDIAAFAGLTASGSAFGFLGGSEPGEHWADLGAAHTVSGNPMRFATGRVPIRCDVRWRTAMPASQRRLVTAMTLPLLARYGYAGGTR
jgi:Sulfotransferase family